MFETSCQPQVANECYESLPRPANPDPATPENIAKWAYCDWTLGTLPPPPDGYAYTHRISAGFVPSEDDPCDPCDVERLDALLSVAIEEKEDPIEGDPSCARLEPSEPVRGCVHPPDDDNDECEVLGVFFSKYADVPMEETGCRDCSVEGACPGVGPG